MQGQRSLQSRLARLIMSRAHAAGLRPARRLLRHGRATTTRRCSTALELRATSDRKTSPTASRSARAWSGSARWRRRPSSSTTCPTGYVEISSGARRGAAAQHHGLPGALRGAVKAVIELASFQRVQPHPPHLPRSAHPVIGVVLNMISASMRTEELLQELQRSNAELAARSKELEEKASEPRGQEPRDRARQRLARRERRAAGADLQVQVRVPRQHVPRAAHAAEQPAHPGPAARRQRGPDPHRQAGRVRPDHLRRRAATCWRSSTRSSTSPRSRLGSIEIQAGRVALEDV